MIHSSYLSIQLNQVVYKPIFFNNIWSQKLKFSIKLVVEWIFVIFIWIFSFKFKIEENYYVSLGRSWACNLRRLHTYVIGVYIIETFDDDRIPKL